MSGDWALEIEIHNRCQRLQPPRCQGQQLLTTIKLGVSLWITCCHSTIQLTGVPTSLDVLQASDGMWDRLTKTTTKLPYITIDWDKWQVVVEQ